MAKRKQDDTRLSQPITIVTAPKMIKRIAANLKKLIAMGKG